jgi:hypothetical protein
MTHELRSYEALFHGLQRIESVRLKATSETLEKQIARIVPPLSLDQSVADVQFINLDTSMSVLGGTAILLAEPNPSFNRGRLDFVLKSEKGLPAPRKSVEVTFVPEKPISGYFFREWILQNPATKKLVSKDRGLEVFMPASREFWTEIQAMVPTDAIKVIQGKDDATKYKLSFLGLSVDRSAASWISPLVATLVLLYLIAHLRHATQLTASPAEKQAASAFPWVGVFSDRIGTVVAYISICLLPVVSTWSLYLRSHEMASSFGVFTLALTLIVTACSLWGARQLHEFRTFVGVSSVRLGRNSVSSSSSNIEVVQSEVEG